MKKETKELNKSLLKDALIYGGWTFLFVVVIVNYEFVLGAVLVAYDLITRYFGILIGIFILFSIGIMINAYMNLYDRIIRIEDMVEQIRDDQLYNNDD